MKSFLAKNEELNNKKWYVVDAKTAPLGKIAVKVANLLSGKEKPIYTPNVDCGDNVIVINTDQVQLTGKKLTDKLYYRHSEYQGGLKCRTAEEQIKLDSRKVIEMAVAGMLPKTRLGKQMYRKLHVYKDDKFEQVAQKPEKVEVL